MALFYNKQTTFVFNILFILLNGIACLTFLILLFVTIYHLSTVSRRVVRETKDSQDMYRQFHFITSGRFLQTGQTIWYLAICFYMMYLVLTVLAMTSRMLAVNMEFILAFCVIMYSVAVGLFGVILVTVGIEKAYGTYVQEMYLEAFLSIYDKRYSSFQRFWHEFQQSYSCCGVKSAFDYLRTRDYIDYHELYIKLPQSCCSSKIGNCNGTVSFVDAALLTPCSDYLMQLYSARKAFCTVCLVMVLLFAILITITVILMMAPRYLSNLSKRQKKPDVTYFVDRAKNVYPITGRYYGDDPEEEMEYKVRKLEAQGLENGNNEPKKDIGRPSLVRRPQIKDIIQQAENYIKKRESSTQPVPNSLNTSDHD
ncbi:hypothetical protein Ciccas_012336 [Cichlidogyrus casuarinus]|uniref:Tetraspanin n=1 Tax=Cichlidogyrus casuarinus TaxID=1844966 RepID=A0ABD2PPW3_9PLAT